MNDTNTTVCFVTEQFTFFTASSYSDIPTCITCESDIQLLNRDCYFRKMFSGARKSDYGNLLHMNAIENQTFVKLPAPLQSSPHFCWSIVLK